MRPICLLAGFAALLASATSSFAQSAENFYRGKTLSIYIGFSAGGTYDYFGRLLSRHLSRHIPGNPTVIAQAMPGAGNLTLPNWM